MSRQRQRSRMPDAHVDSTLVVMFSIGVVLFATWIAYETRNVISPYWLGSSIAVLALYQLAILWMLRQSWEIDRIMTIFSINILSLSTIMNTVSYVLNVSLPTNLPFHSVLIHLAGIEASSTSPGTVALSYTMIAVIVGSVVMVIAGLVEDTKPVCRVKRLLKLDKLDLRIDLALEKVSGRLEDVPAAWLVVPLGLMAVAMIVVIGGAGLIS